jgi:phosphate transport system protein
MSHPFEAEISGLKEKLLVMGGHAERAAADAVRSLVQRDSELARAVLEKDAVLDRFEIEIDEDSIHILAGAPLAGDLRFITVAMKISHNLERVGDEAGKIAKRSIDLASEPPLKLYADLPRMSTLTLEMLKDALDAFVQRHPENARAVIGRDDEVDAMNRETYRELAAFMVECPASISRCLNVMGVSRSLERIADHATNIAEEIVYLYEARDIRHAGTRP